MLSPSFTCESSSALSRWCHCALIHARFSKAPKHSPNRSRSLKILNHDSKSEIHTKLGLLRCTTTMYFIINSQLQKNISLDIRAWLSVLMCIRFLLTLLSFLFTLIYPSPLSSSLLLMPHFKTRVCVYVCVCCENIYPHEKISQRS